MSVSSPAAEPAAITTRMPSVVRTGRGSDPPPRGSVPLIRGQWLLPQAPPPVWSQMAEVTRARAVAVMRNLDGALALSHEIAVLVHGGWLRRHEPDIDVLVGYRPSRTSTPVPPVVYGADRARPAPTARGRPALGAHEVAGRAVVVRRRVRGPLPEGDVVIRDGLAVTSVTRTLADCLLDLPAADALVAGDSLLRLAVAPDRRDPQAAQQRWAQVLQEVEERVRACVGRQGRRRALRLLALLSPWSESPLESEVRRVLLEAGLPVPELQHRVHLDGSTYYLDLYWPQIALAIEVDGRGKYTGSQAVYAEAQRQDRIQRAGMRILRVKREMLAEPGRLVGEVLAAAAPGRLWSLQPRAWMSALEPLPRR